MEIALLVIVIVLQIIIIYFVFPNKKCQTFGVNYGDKTDYYQPGQYVNIKVEKETNASQVIFSDERLVYQLKDEGGCFSISFVMPDHDIDLLVNKVCNTVVSVELSNEENNKPIIIDSFSQETIKITVNKDLAKIVLYRLYLESIDDNGQPIYKKEARYFFENCNKAKKYLLRLDLNNNYGLTAYDDVGEINYYLIFDKNTSNIYLEEYY